MFLSRPVGKEIRPNFEIKMYLNTSMSSFRLCFQNILNKSNCCQSWSLYHYLQCPFPVCFECALAFPWLFLKVFQGFGFFFFCLSELVEKLSKTKELQRFPLTSYTEAAQQIVQWKTKLLQ